MESQQRVMHSDVKVAHRQARHMRRELATHQAYSSVDVPEPPHGLSSYFFELQGQIEKEGFMDYHKYARRMWSNFFGEINDNTRQNELDFENSMIAGLYSIDMEPLVYPHVKDNLAMLLRAREHQVKGLSLWSTGDVAATGYQVGKIEQSGVIRDFLRTVKEEVPLGERKRVYEKTHYMVDDDKFERLANYVEESIKSGERNPKLVIVEDSSKNFEKIREVLGVRFGEGNGIEVVPIWAAYSREGQTEEKKAVEDQDYDSFVSKRKRLNAIDSFAELLDPRFDNVFQDAHVFVDFDGVIGDNVKMRQEQAKVIYQSLLNAGINAGLSPEEINNRLKMSG